jgi:hypothetical protein
MQNPNETPEPSKVTLHTVCRACGGTEFLLEQAFAEEKAKGKIGENVISLGILVPPPAIAVFDQSKMIVGGEAPGYVINVDVCVNCGALVARRITELPVHIQPPPLGQIDGILKNNPELKGMLWPKGFPPDGNFRNQKGKK